MLSNPFRQRYWFFVEIRYRGGQSGCSGAIFEVFRWWEIGQHIANHICVTQWCYPIILPWINHDHPLNLISALDSPLISEPSLAEPPPSWRATAHHQIPATETNYHKRENTSSIEHAYGSFPPNLNGVVSISSKMSISPRSSLMCH